jgi:hypothetical protein
MHATGKRIVFLLIVAVLGLWLANATSPVYTGTVVSSSAVDPTILVPAEAEKVSPPKALD